MLDMQAASKIFRTDRADTHALRSFTLKVDRASLSPSRAIPAPAKPRCSGLLGCSQYWSRRGEPRPSLQPWQRGVYNAVAAFWVMQAARWKGAVGA